MIEMGLLCGLGLIIVMAKASWRVRMKMLSNPVKMDIAVFLLLFILHAPGTFAGTMVATIAALMVSLILSLGRKMFGYIGKTGYVPGVLNISHELAGA